MEYSVRANPGLYQMLSIISTESVAQLKAITTTALGTQVCPIAAAGTSVFVCQFPIQSF